MNRENITVYWPKTKHAATELFEMFKQMKLDNLDEERFNVLFEQGNGEVGFCAMENTWQICDPKCDLYNVTLVEMNGGQEAYEPYEPER